MVQPTPAALGWLRTLRLLLKQHGRRRRRTEREPAPEISLDAKKSEDNSILQALKFQLCKIVGGIPMNRFLEKFYQRREHQEFYEAT